MFPLNLKTLTELCCVAELKDPADMFKKNEKATNFNFHIAFLRLDYHPLDVVLKTGVFLRTSSKVEFSVMFSL